MLSLHLLFRFGVFGILAGLAIAVLAMILQGDVRRVILFLILSWGVSEGYVARLSVAYYTDPNGIRNSFGVGSLLLVIVFVGLLAKDGAFVGRFLRTPMFGAFYVLFACAVLSQVWHLGFLPGVGLAYDRVLQPMMVVAVMGYLGRSQSGLRWAFLWIIGAVVLAISLRYAAGMALGPESVSWAVGAAGGVRRVSGLGSWTIYGTICASILPLVVALVAVDRGRAERVALFLVGLVTVKEVLATGTRGAILGFVALTVFLLRRKARWWMVALVAAVLVGAVAFGFRAGFSGERAVSLNVGTMLSEPNTRGRFERNLAAVHYMAEHPLSGSGLGLPLRVDGVDIGTWVYNPYLAWGVAMGLIASLAFAAIVGMSIVYSIGNWRASSGNLRTLQVGLTASLIVWLVNQFTTGDSLTYLQSVQASFFFYAIAGLIVGSRLGRQRPMSTTPKESG